MFVRPPRGFSRARAEQAVELAVDFASRNGFAADGGELIAEGANLLVRLAPEPALVRLSNWVDILRVEGSLPWNQREVVIARHLASAGKTAAQPLVEPVREDGITKSVWEWLDHEPHPQPDAHDLGSSLAELHAALESCEDPLVDYRDVMRELIPLSGLIEGDEAQREVARLLPARVERILEAVERIDPPLQALHGDAHSGNVVAIAGEIVWIDFEDTCRGPVEFDLACVLAHGRLRGDVDEAAFLSGYARNFDAELFELLVDARICAIVCWCALLLDELEDAHTRRRIEWWLENAS